MATIRVYKLGIGFWVSPGKLWGAIKRGGIVRIINHTDYDPSAMMRDAVLQALARLRYMFLASAAHGLNGFLWAAALFLLLRWPPLMQYAPNEVWLILRAIMVCVTGLTLARTGMAIFQWLRMKRFRKHIIEAPIIRAAKMPSPPEAYAKEIRRMPSLWTSAHVLLLAVILSSIAIATPAVPAMTQGEIIGKTQLIMPWQTWEMRQRYMRDYTVGAFLVEDENIVWVVRLEFAVENVDLEEDPGEWRQWVDSRLSSIVNNIANYIYSNIPADTEVALRNANTIEGFEEMLSLIESAMAEGFDEMHENMRMIGIRASVEAMSIPQYQAIKRRFQ